MPRGDRLYLGHMLDACRKAVEKTRNIDRATFDGDEDIVWEVATSDLPPLVQKIEHLLPDEPPNQS